MRLNNPPRLKKGDTIAIVSPSSGLAELFPHRVERGKNMLEKLGFNVIFAPHSKQREGWVSASPEERTNDIHWAFNKKEVDAVMCSIGGNHANQLLKFLDFDLIRKNPKIFLGYSDITILHYAFAKKAFLRTFYGPCLITEFGEYPEILPYTLEYFKKGLMEESPIGEVAASNTWTDEFLDWFTKADTTRSRELNSSEGYEWWKKGCVTAPVWGGAIPTINHLAGTDYWINPSGMVLLIDIPEGDPGKPYSQSWLDSFFADLDNLGVFKSIYGLVIGRPYKYTDNLTSSLRAIIERYTKDYTYPILFNANIGHAAPIMTLPLGVSVTLDSERNSFSVNESGVC